MATAPSLFGATPESIQQQQAAALDAQAMQYAQMSPFQRATYGIYKGANQLGGVVGGMLGGQDPQMAKASQMQQIASQYDASTPDGLQQLARAFAGAGFNQEALQASQAAQAQQLQAAQLGKTNAEQAVITTKAARDAQFTAGMAALPEDATDKDRLALAMATGSQADVIKAIEMSNNKKIASDNALAMFKERQDNEDRRLRERGEQRVGEQQRLFQQQQFMAQLTASLKGPNISELKRQDAVEKAAEGKDALAGTLSSAQALITRLGASGGMSSVGNSGLSNLLTKGQTSIAGQWLGGAFGTTNQADRDVLSSLRLQLLNDVKASEKMGSGQLNSNVELKTWLDSLGSPGSTMEANQAILNTISNRYLKNTNQPAGGLPGIGPKTPSSTSPQQAQAPQYASNPSTGQRIVSTDGGVTWQPRR